MTLDEWKGQWKRLNHFHTRGDVDRDKLSAEWFRHVMHWHVDAVEAGITKLIGAAEDNFLPGVGLLKGYIQERIDRYDRTPGKCGSCGGSGWVDAPPFKSNGLIYANTVRRCTACGIPEPVIDVGRREAVGDLQTHEYARGRYGREQMPPGLEAKYPGAVVNPELKALAESLKARLFGAQGETA